MSKKIKKYIFLIPTLIVMLLNCVCYGQVIASEDNTFISAMPDNYIDPHTDLQMILDIRDFTDYLNVDFSDVLYDDYLYIAKCSLTAYDNLINGLSDQLTISFDLFDFSSVEITSYDGFFYCRVNRQGRSFKYTKSKNSFSLSSNSYTTKMHCYFNDDFSNYSCSSTSNNIDQAIDNSDTVILAIQSNVVDFNSSNLNVSVSFNPDLSGVVDRSVTLDDGSTALKNSLNMIIRNNSKFDIQYSMSIYRKEDYPEIGGTAPGVYPVFRYFTKDWVYGNSLDNSAAYFNSVEKQNKATASHLLWSGRTDTILFDYNQLPLSEGVEYTVVVTATRNDYKYASEIIVPSYEDIYPDLFQVYQQEIVFRSDFIMKQYSDVKYDRNNTTNGVLPYQGKDDYSAYENSYYAKEDSDGNIDYEGKDVYNDPDSWYTDKFNHDINHDKAYPGLVGDKESGGSSDGTFTSFASSFTNYFQFLAYIFNYFPVGMKNVFLIGFVGIMAVVLLKVVFKS